MTYELLAWFIQKNSNCQPSTRRRHLSDFQIDDEHNQLHNPFQLGYITPFTHHSADAIHSFFWVKTTIRLPHSLQHLHLFHLSGKNNIERYASHLETPYPTTCWRVLTNLSATFIIFFIIFLHFSSNISSSFVLFNPSSSYWCLVGNGLEWGEWDDYW